jgi:hypothetical protein
MREYLVIWKIFVEAESPEEAAREALGIQRNANSGATLFEVKDEWGLDEGVVAVDEPEPRMHTTARILLFEHRHSPALTAVPARPPSSPAHAQGS